MIDSTNLSQNVMTAIESVAQTLKQIEQYRTQLQQYENQLQNTTPAAYIWDQAQTTINGLMAAVIRLTTTKPTSAAWMPILASFRTWPTTAARHASASGCSAAERAAMDDNRRLASESRSGRTMHSFTAWSFSSKHSRPTPERWSSSSVAQRGPRTDGGDPVRQPACQPAGQSTAADPRPADRPTERRGPPVRRARLILRRGSGRLTWLRPSGAAGAFPSSPMRW